MTFTSLTLESLQTTSSLILPFFLLYPEIHYRFRFFPFSRYFKKEPEIIADIPHRIDRDQRIPVFVLVKDAHLYPTSILSVRIIITKGANSDELIFPVQEEIRQHWWWKKWDIAVNESWIGHTVQLRIVVEYRTAGVTHTVEADNIIGTTKAPFDVYVSGDHWPQPQGWFNGDLHVHSDYTEDAIEYGAPLPMLRAASEALGLNFIAVTDHSYDLDNKKEDYNQSDPTLAQWRAFLESVKQMNDESTSKVLLLAGEELSCMNIADENIHALILNSDQFFYGSGDGGKNPLNTSSEHTVSEMTRLLSKKALIMAAHPLEKPSPMERTFLQRGVWRLEDFYNRSAEVLQILNGSNDTAFKQGLGLWVHLLLSGRRVYIVAGNDAHGNFNRNRQVRIPFWTIEDVSHYKQLGWARTVLYLGEQKPNTENTINTIREGCAIISTGPYIVFNVVNEAGLSSRIGQNARGRRFRIAWEASSTQEFGALETISVFQGVIGEPHEKVSTVAVDSWCDQGEFHTAADAPSYIRLSVTTKSQNFCYTNPIWLE